MVNEMEPIFTSKLIQACITCIKIINNSILAGVGGTIYIYNVVTASFQRRFKIFEGSKIHGMEINLADKQIFIFSGQKMKLIRYENDLKIFQENPHFCLKTGFSQRNLSTIIQG
ncbi:hypothetical protein HHI36_012889 [Cryptolaemus montrouzieri]|uniref:Uncharacterized protein n=1 Tax=Cryptolaemus montrouzieri TaxID=559131 RepID=A0ABD2NFS8_9CUCU